MQNNSSFFTVFRKIFTVSCVKKDFILISAIANLQKEKYHFNRVTEVKTLFGSGSFKFVWNNDTIIKFYQIFVRQK